MTGKPSIGWTWQQAPYWKKEQFSFARGPTFRFLNIHFSPQFEAYLLIVLQSILSVLLMDYLWVFLGWYRRGSATVSLPLRDCSFDLVIVGFTAGRDLRGPTLGTLLYPCGVHSPRGIKGSVSMLVCVFRDVSSNLNVRVTVFGIVSDQCRLWTRHSNGPARWIWKSPKKLTPRATAVAPYYFTTDSSH
jgi:hypothetical protein